MSYRNNLETVFHMMFKKLNEEHIRMGNTPGGQGLGDDYYYWLCDIMDDLNRKLYSDFEHEWYISTMKTANEYYRKWKLLRQC